MSTTYVITRKEGKLFSFLLEGNTLIEAQAHAAGRSLLGNIYVGKVKHILKNIDAAFVEIAGGQTCFLPLAQAKSPVLTNRHYDGRLAAGDEILVQVKQDALKTKEPVLTASLSFPGRYCAVQTGGKRRIAYSHKLEEGQRRELEESLAGLELPEGLCLTVRTQAGTLSDRTPLFQEAERLIRDARRVLQIGPSRTVFSLLSQEKPGYLKNLENARQLPDRIVTEDGDIYTQLQAFLAQFAPGETGRLSLYQQEKPTLFQLYGLSAKLEEAFSRQVWLKSGGYLVIEPTEALTVIDVNTGKFSGKKGTEETYEKINREAALEIARQLRLRNLSGIILADFINLNTADGKKELMELLRETCRKDPTPTQVVDMTSLGLVEITRKKVRKPLWEQFRES